MNPALFLARRWAGLPPGRFSCSATTSWVAMADGTRLATTVALPDAPAKSRPAVLMRSQLPAHRRAHPGHVLARLLATSGFCAVVQECRGHYASEGRCRPFAHEAADGSDAVAWVVRQPWFGERLGLLGVGYAGFCAWSALAAAREPVDALAVGLSARDPHAVLYPGGALALEVALGWAFGLGERELIPARALDLERAARFRPVREADRVARREASCFREWLDHPERDAYWEALVPGVPRQPPPALIYGSWSHPAVDAALADWRALDTAARASGAPAPTLVIDGDPKRRFRSGPLGGFLREALAFLDARLAGGIAPERRVRVFSTGASRWREGDTWPPAAAGSRCFHLRSGGRANGRGGDGRLEEEAAANGEAPDSFSYDPDAPVPTPSRAGLRRGRARAPAADRSDVLCYTSAPLESDLEVCGSVHLALFAASTAPDTDFTAGLLDVAPDGSTHRLCDGVLRCRAREPGRRDAWLEPGRPERLEVALGSASHRFRAGHRLRLEVSSSNFPRFDRNPNAKVEPARAEESDCALARQSVYHDRERASHLVLAIADD